MTIRLGTFTVSSFTPQSAHHTATSLHAPFQKNFTDCTTSVAPVAWGRNVLAQVLPTKNAPITHIGNYENEVVWGGDTASRAKNIKTFEPYAGRTAGIFPNGSVVLVPEQFLRQVQETMRYQRELGLIGTMHAVGIPDSGADSAIGRAIVHAADIRAQLDALNVGMHFVPVIAGIIVTTCCY